MDRQVIRECPDLGITISWGIINRREWHGRRVWYADSYGTLWTDRCIQRMQSYFADYVEFLDENTVVRTPMRSMHSSLLIGDHPWIMPAPPAITDAIRQGFGYDCILKGIRPTAGNYDIVREMFEASVIYEYDGIIYIVDNISTSGDSQGVEYEALRLAEEIVPNAQGILSRGWGIDDNGVALYDTPFILPVTRGLSADMRSRYWRTGALRGRRPSPEHREEFQEEMDRAAEAGDSVFSLGGSVSEIISILEYEYEHS